ncbi:hypothetical protein F1542_10715 [Komagataeibacter sp. FXV3]|nr:hypothetical protein [Komagataeibacter sp. FXV3]
MMYGDMFDRIGIQPAAVRMPIMLAGRVMPPCGMPDGAVGNTMRGHGIRHDRCGCHCMMGSNQRTKQPTGKDEGKSVWRLHGRNAATILGVMDIGW